MAKKDPLVGKTFKLLESLLDLSGEPHPHAGEVVTVLERSGRNGYKVSTPDDAVIVVQTEDWDPTDADMQKMLAAPGAGVSAEVAEQLQTINLYTDPSKNVAVMIDLDLIDDSPSQPRTFYPEDYLDGLAASMRAVGMISPMLVRPKAGGRFENVFGHCRKRGAKRADLKQGPCFVRDLTDAESAQLQAVENLQRKDLDAFDEAKSFAAYINAHGCSKDEFAQRTGLSRTLVYNRLKLATLHAAGVKALREGVIKPEVATLIARVPSEKHQAHALKLILDGSPSESGRPVDELMTVRKARDMIREKFTLGLKDAIWKPDDATLVPSAGACITCPKRSGVDPVLYTDLFGKPHTWSNTPSGENVCTDPACFDTKKTAQLKANQAVLEAKGKTVIAGNKARQVVGAYGDIKGGYIPLKDVKDAIKQAAAKGKPAPEVVTVQNPRDGKTVEVVKIDDIKAAGVKFTAPKVSGQAGYGSDAWKAQEAQREADRKKAQDKARRETESNIAVFAAVHAAMAGKQRTADELVEVAQLMIDRLRHNEDGIIATIYDVKNMRELGKQLPEMTVDQLGRLIVECTLLEGVNTHYSSSKPTPLMNAAKRYGVDVEAARKTHADQKKADVAAGGKQKAAKAAEALETNDQDELDEVDA